MNRRKSDQKWWRREENERKWRTSKKTEMTTWRMVVESGCNRRKQHCGLLPKTKTKIPSTTVICATIDDRADCRFNVYLCQQVFISRLSAFCFLSLAFLFRFCFGRKIRKKSGKNLSVFFPSFKRHICSLCAESITFSVSSSAIFSLW